MKSLWRILPNPRTSINRNTCENSWYSRNELLKRRLSMQKWTFSITSLEVRGPSSSISSLRQIVLMCRRGEPLTTQPWVPLLSFILVLWAARSSQRRASRAQRHQAAIQVYPAASLLLPGTHRDLFGSDEGSDPLEQDSVGIHSGKVIKITIYAGSVPKLKWQYRVFCLFVFLLVCFLFTVGFEILGKVWSPHSSTGLAFHSVVCLLCEPRKTFYLSALYPKRVHKNLWLHHTYNINP